MESKFRHIITYMHCSVLAVVLSSVLLFACTSCSDSPEMEKLTLTETLIEERPDSAFTILSGIDKNGLKSRREKAKYALLMSMALDKNYVDTTTFDILQPAIDYYLRKGTPDEKLKTYYYQGRIYQNQGDRDNALGCFLKGLDFSKECKDSLVIARSLVASGYLYKDFFDIESCAKNYLQAAVIYKSLLDKDHEFDCLLSAINSYLHLENENITDSLISLCENFNNLDDNQRNKLTSYKLSRIIKFGTSKELEDFLENEGTNWVGNNEDILDLAHAFNKIGDNAKAQQYINYVSQNGGSVNMLKYRATCVYILSDVGNYKDALSMYVQFSQLNDSIDFLKFDQKLHTMAEKHQFEMKAQEERLAKSRILWGSICGLVLLAMVIAILILLVRSNKAKKLMAEKREQVKILENSKLKAEQEKLELEKARLGLENENLQLEHQKKVLEAENLSHRVEDLENESEALKNLLKDKDVLPEEVRRAIQIRIEMLNSLLASHITDNDQYEKSYDGWVKETTENIDDFMDSNRLAFQATHPKFIKYFEGHGLTTAEINYVCLYAIGLRGKEVGNYIKKRSHVNISSAIRKKLGIDKHDTNLGIYVRKLLKSI